MRVLVCGGRDYTNEDVVFWHIDNLLDMGRSLTIIEGGARGADALAARFADRNHLQCGHEQYKANWTKYGKAAGGIRNQEMLDSGVDLVLAFPGGRGTADMVRRAKAAGVEVREITE